MNREYAKGFKSGAMHGLRLPPGINAAAQYRLNAEKVLKYAADCPYWQGYKDGSAVAVS